MKIGIVVPLEMLGEITEFVKKEFPDLTAVPFPYRSIPEIPKILSGQQNKADAFLFLGETARRFAESAIRPSAEWLAIPRSASALLRILFRASSAGMAMRIVTDCPREDFFRLAFQEIGIPPEQYEVTLLSARSYDEARLREEADRIEALWRSGKIDFCVTIFFNIRDLLLERHVPVYVLQPSFEDIRGGIERLILSHELRLSRNSQLAVIAVKTDIPEDRFPADSGYELAFAQLHVTKRIYQFARAIQAACIELAPAEYLLFTTRSLVESGTAQYRRLPLLDTVRRETPFTLSVGFGLGATAEEAKLHAQRAMAHAAASGGGRAFLIGSGIFSPAPMSRNDRQDQQTESRPYQEAFLSLAKRTGISLRVLARLHRAMTDTGRRRFTSAELADLAEITPRTMNRILQKLLDHGLARETGRQFTARTGRPSRILELLIRPEDN